MKNNHNKTSQQLASGKEAIRLLKRMVKRGPVGSIGVSIHRTLGCIYCYKPAVYDPGRIHIENHRRHCAYRVAELFLENLPK
jgi:hypothetical protein